MSLDPPRRTLPPHTALRAFEAAARHQSFAAAAQELCVTPAAVAQQVKSLEDWLGGPLFERRARGVVLTPRAQRAWPALAQALDQLGLAVQTLRTEVNTRELQLVALPAVDQLWLSPRLPALRVRRVHFPATLRCRCETRHPRRMIRGRGVGNRHPLTVAAGRNRLEDRRVFRVGRKQHRRVDGGRRREFRHAQSFAGCRRE